MVKSINTCINIVGKYLLNTYYVPGDTALKKTQLTCSWEAPIVMGETGKKINKKTKEYFWC